MISERAASPRPGSRQTITSVAPIRARASAISLPIPAFAPVTITTLLFMPPDVLDGFSTSISFPIGFLRVDGLASLEHLDELSDSPGPCLGPFGGGDPVKDRVAVLTVERRK